MTEMMPGVEHAEESRPGLDGLDERLHEQLACRAGAGGLQLTGGDGVVAAGHEYLAHDSLLPQAQAILDALGIDPC